MLYNSQRYLDFNHQNGLTRIGGEFESGFPVSEVSLSCSLSLSSSRLISVNPHESHYFALLYEIEVNFNNNLSVLQERASRLTSDPRYSKSTIDCARRSLRGPCPISRALKTCRRWCGTRSWRTRRSNGRNSARSIMIRAVI